VTTLATGLALAMMALPAAKASSNSHAAASKRCTRAAATLVKRTRHAPIGLPQGTNGSFSPICFDFTGDGRRDVAFAILSGGTAGATHWAVFRGVRTSSRRLSRRYRKVAERFSGSKTRLLRSGRLLVVQTPIYNQTDANCCPTGGANQVLYRVERSRVVKVSSRTIAP
jgi:hypothetical protein